MLVEVGVDARIAIPMSNGISTRMMSGFAGDQVLKVSPLISSGTITGINTTVMLNQSMMSIV